MRALPILLCGVLAACGVNGKPQGDAVAPSGGGATRSYSVRDFAKVEVAGADDVEVRTGGEFSVIASGAPEVLDELEIRRDGDTLHVGRKPGTMRWAAPKRHGSPSPCRRSTAGRSRGRAI